MMRLNVPAVRAAKFVAFLTMVVLLAGVPARVASAQGVTSGTIKGLVLDAQKNPVAGATVIAIHLPSGTTYQSSTQADGRFLIPGMRLGGPYSVRVAPGGASAKFQEASQDDILVSLGAASDLVFNVQPVVQEAITVLGASDTIFNTQRTGASTTMTREQLGVLPTISGRLNDITRLTPQSGGTLSFGGQDSRMNNITVDGSYFNNSFGLRNSPGDTSGVAPISLAAIEQIQVNIAPYDVRQGNFVGANVNTVTRSGGNAWHASFYHQFRNNSLVGTDARGATVNPGTFDFRNTGGWVSGAIKKNKAFFFGNFEDEIFVQPGTTFRANLGGEPAVGNVTRVLASDLDELSAFLKTNFGYDTGPYQDYDTTTPARRYLVKTDFNMNDHNKLVVRYNHLDSLTDNLVSNSTSAGAPSGNRRTPFTNGLHFENSGYQQLENIRSIVGEWNSIIGTNMANNLIAGFTSHDESRGYMSTLFPFVDILEQSQVYTSFGFEPFTPNNELRYKSYQVQNNFQEFAKNHALTFGVSAERYESENVFNSTSQSVYAYNSLADFYTDARAYLNGTGPTGVSLRRFDIRWNNIPGQEKPLQPLKVFYAGGYVQDDWQARSNLTLNIGLRWDAPFFSQTGFQNVNADALIFRDENGNDVQYKTGELPGANSLWSPRAGFNWDINSDRTTQLRGGSGVFSGRPAYVWISNQVGNTGMLTGTERVDNTTLRPFSPLPETYKPANVTGAPASSYNLELVNPDFTFPQVWRTDIAVDHRLPWDLVATFEAIYNRDLNGIYYINANLPAAQSAFTGADTRMRWTNNRINNVVGNQVTSAVVLKNQNVGRSWNVAGTLEKMYRSGLWMKTAYSYGEARNTVDPGSQAAGSFNNNPQDNDPNNPGLSISNQSPGHRFFAVGAHSRDFFKFGINFFFDVDAVDL